MMNKRSENIIILLLGIIIGLLGGILTAPTKGENIRSGLIYSLKQYSEKIKILIKKLTKKGAHTETKAKNEGKEVVDDVITSAQKILEEADILTAELEQ